MASFEEVFSTTWKVVAAVFLVSLIIAIGTGLLGGIANLVFSNSPSATASTSSIATSTEFEDYKADNLHTSMPKSNWDAGIARAAKAHCFAEGMSKEEIVRALGEPAIKHDYSETIGSIWEWDGPPGECLLYDGDNCTQRKKETKSVIFTPKGHVRGALGCETLAGNFVYYTNSSLFAPDPHVVERKRVRNLEAEAASWQTQKGCEHDGYIWDSDHCRVRFEGECPKNVICLKP